MVKTTLMMMTVLYLLKLPSSGFDRPPLYPHRSRFQTLTCELRSRSIPGTNSSRSGYSRSKNGSALHAVVTWRSFAIDRPRSFCSLRERAIRLTIAVGDDYTRLATLPGGACFDLIDHQLPEGSVETEQIVIRLWFVRSQGFVGFDGFLLREPRRVFLQFLHPLLCKSISVLSERSPQRLRYLT